MGLGRVLLKLNEYILDDPKINDPVEEWGLSGNLVFNNNNIYLLTAIGLLPCGSGYFTCKQNKKLVTAKFKSGGLHEKHVVATWNLGNHLSICL